MPEDGPTKRLPSCSPAVPGSSSAAGPTEACSLAHSAALAHHRAGHPQQARALADSALAIAQTYACPEATGLAVRTLGVLTGNLDALNEATCVLATTEARLEYAGALVEFGACLLPGQPPQRRARTTANRPRPRRPPRRHRTAPAGNRGTRRSRACPRHPHRSGLEALSPSEHRVARLAAQGQHNRDIAQALFVTTKTVEVHLTSCYRKLGITSRTDLAALLR